METIIKKAIEGGFGKVSDEIVNTNDIGVSFKSNSGIVVYRSNDSLVLDPLFWQSLGKACGWGTDILSPIGQVKGYEWRGVKFHLINLTEGWNSAVTYLENLVK